MVSQILNFCENEHKKIDRLYNDYVESKTSDTKTKLKRFKEFKCSLHRHMVVEEDVLFEFYKDRKKIDHDEMIDRMMSEHEIIRDQLNKIQKLIQSDDARTGNIEMELMALFQSHGICEDKLLVSFVESIKNKEEEERILADLDRFSFGCCRHCSNN